MNPYLSVLLFLLISVTTFGQKQAYILYNARGKKISYNRMLKSIAKKDVLLFGELHNNPISHWLQYELTTDLNDKRSIMLGAEMMEADNQDELDDYLNEVITYKELDSLARLWPNYKTDYGPLVDFAKENKLEFIATNIPRRFAKKVFRYGFESLDSLSPEEKMWVAPLPIAFDPDLPKYRQILEMMGDHGTPELVKAQASKDATMAYFILKHFKEPHLFIHYNGAYHSDDYEGILWYLKSEKPELDYITITTVSQKNVRKLLPEHHKKADFIICVDEDMTTTY